MPEAISQNNLFVMLYKQLLESEAPSEELARIARDFLEGREAAELESHVREFSKLKNAAAAAIARDALNRLLVDNEPESVFYDRLWRFISENDLLVGQDERALALMVALAHDGIPYVQFDLVEMDNDRFLETMNQLRSDLRQIRGIAHRPYAQRTQRASAFLNIIDKHESEEERAVLMSAIMTELGESEE